MKITKGELKRLIVEELSLIDRETEDTQSLAVEEQKDEDWTSDEARELQLYIENDRDLYRQQYLPIIKNLSQKKVKGIFDSQKAIKLFMYLIDNGAQKYMREHGSSDGKWFEIFPKSARIEVAKSLLDYFEKEYELGNYDNLVSSKKEE